VSPLDHVTRLSPPPIRRAKQAGLGLRAGAGAGACVRVLVRVRDAQRARHVTPSIPRGARHVIRAALRSKRPWTYIVLLD
jgi:hypothetical protein